MVVDGWLGRYSIYRRVVAYYQDSDGGESDAFDMRMPLSRDTERKHVREHGEEFRVGPEDVW